MGEHQLWEAHCILPLYQGPTSNGGPRPRTVVPTLPTTQLTKPFLCTPQNGPTGPRGNSRGPVMATDRDTEAPSRAAAHAHQQEVAELGPDPYAPVKCQCQRAPQPWLLS